MTIKSRAVFICIGVKREMKKGGKRGLMNVGKQDARKDYACLTIPWS